MGKFRLYPLDQLMEPTLAGYLIPKHGLSHHHSLFTLS